MAGYDGFSMSNNARLAYEAGEKPKSKWTKDAIILELKRAGVDPVQIAVVRRFPASVLKEIGLSRSSWHHTSSRYNRTDFYTVDVDRLERLKISDLDYYKEAYAKEPKREAKGERWVAEYLVWSGTRKHPRAEEVRSEGTLKGDWFYLDDGTRKSINARGFRLIRRLRSAPKPLTPPIRSRNPVLNRNINRKPPSSHI